MATAHHDPNAPKRVGLHIKHQKPLSPLENLVFWEVIKGMVVTLKHFFVNFFTHKKTVTVRYPEERQWISSRWRGRHWLTFREDGNVTCVACMMCAMNCPANCIDIKAKELDKPYYTKRQKVDKAPETFTINLGLCVMCGLCVEACPEDAIRMDSGIVGHAVDSRDEFPWDTMDLLNPPVTHHPIIHQDLKEIPEDRLPNLKRRFLQEKKYTKPFIAKPGEGPNRMPPLDRKHP